MNKLIAALAVLPLLAACGGSEESGDLTADEARQLNEAAAMLDENVEAVAVSEDAAANSGDVLVSDAPPEE